METFIQLVAKDLIRRFGTDLRGLTVVFPNKRAGLFMNQHLAATARKPMWAPKYSTISELFDTLSDFGRCDDIQAVCELYSIYSGLLPDAEPLDRFYGWGEIMLADFDDIDGLWGEAYIDFTARRELFNGTGDGLFSPDQPMTRAMFVTVLWRMAGSPEAQGETTFLDLKEDWYRQAVLWAVNNGITDGYSEELFGPNDPVNREQMCVFLCRFLEYLGWSLDLDQIAADFNDADQISSWAVEYVDVCTRSGLIEGVGENTFEPKRSASRMEVSTLLTRFITKVIEKFCGV